MGTAGVSREELKKLLELVPRWERHQLQQYLEGRGFTVYDTEETTQLRLDALVDVEARLKEET